MERENGQRFDDLDSLVATTRETVRKRNLPQWYGEAWVYGMTWQNLYKMQRNNQEPVSLHLPAASPLGRIISAWARDAFEEFSSLNHEFSSSYDETTALRKKFDALVRMARKIKQSNRYEVIPEIGRAVESASKEDLPPITTEYLRNDVTTLYYMVGDENRLLIGTKSGDYWKRIELPEKAIDRMNKLNRLSGHYMLHLPYVGKKEESLIPSNPIDIERVGKDIRLPHPARSADELLEDAYFNTRYIMPPEGGEVRYRNAGNLKSMVLIQSRKDIIFARVSTDLGDANVTLNTDYAEWQGPSQAIANVPNDERWGMLVADTYHDMITADEVPTTAYRRMNVRGNGGTAEDSPSYIYIPRKVKLGPGIDPRPPYEGPPRPVKPHKVSGHRRLGNMTAEQHKNIIELEQKLGIDILKWLPEGHTFVRPHVSPKEALEAFDSLPIFIKRRIETQLRENLQRPLN